MKKIALIGSTGSIGTQALNVIEASPNEFKVIALSTYGDIDAICAQANKYKPLYVGIANEDAAAGLQKKLPSGTKLIAGDDASSILAALPEADIILNGIAGIAGLPALLSSLNAGKTVALANKESIICGNELVQEAIKTHGGKILPVDSEHSAIFQCISGNKANELRALHITASGGPFWRLSQHELEGVTIEQALKHPVWSMGQKISVDSATLMNKGLEVIEASFLFNVPYCNIFVLIHPQSIVHSMVEYSDGSCIAQLSVPDMRLAIQYALCYPERGEAKIERLSLSKVCELTFFDGNDRPAIKLAREALRLGGSMPAAYCAADEEAVNMFLTGRLQFCDIVAAVESVMARTGQAKLNSLNDIEQYVEEVKALVNEYN